jgi:hypothetical protein
MNELLQSIKADLLSRHMLPLLAVAGVALLGALSYSVMGGGGGSAKAPAGAPVAPLPSSSPVAIAPPNATAAAAETPAGAQYQTQGSTRNPFTPLAGTPAASAASASTRRSSGSSSSSSKSSGSDSSTSNSTSSKPAPTHSSPSPTSPKPETLPFYSVSALFGLAPTKSGEQPTLTPYEDMKRFEPLPTPKAPLIVFAGVVSKNGQHALFALIVPPILRGEGSCFPSDTHCQAIELATGKSEELEYVKSNGETVAFELKVVKIVKRSTTGGASQVKALHVSRAGRRALRHAGFSSLG